jgi:predicted membrane chloride channel (bestrophin family)
MRIQLDRYEKHKVLGTLLAMRRNVVRTLKSALPARSLEEKQNEVVAEYLLNNPVIVSVQV